MASVRRQGDKWKYDVNFTADGKRKRISRSGFKTKMEAQKAAFEVEASLRSQKGE